MSGAALVGRLLGIAQSSHSPSRFRLHEAVWINSVCHGLDPNGSPPPGSISGGPGPTLATGEIPVACKTPPPRSKEHGPRPRERRSIPPPESSALEHPKVDRSRGQTLETSDRQPIAPEPPPELDPACCGEFVRLHGSERLIPRRGSRIQRRCRPDEWTQRFGRRQSAGSARLVSSTSRSGYRLRSRTLPPGVPVTAAPGLESSRLSFPNRLSTEQIVQPRILFGWRINRFHERCKPLLV